MSKAENLRRLREANADSLGLALLEILKTTHPRLVAKNARLARAENKRTAPVINEQAEPNKRTRGRPKKWANDAERMRAKRGHG